MVKTNGSTRIRVPASDRALYAIFYTVITFLFIITLYPVWFIVVASFSDPASVNSGRLLIVPQGWHLAGYELTFKERGIWIGYANTALYAVGGTALGLAASLSAAYALSRNDLPFRGFFSFAFVFTMYFGGGLIPTYLVVKTLGLVNTRLWMIISGSVSVYNIILIRTYFKSTLPDELREAAFIDGCGNLRFFAVIALPLSKAIVAVIGLYLIVGYWNSYFNALIYLNDESKFPLQIAMRKLLLFVSSAAEEESDDASYAMRRQMAQVMKYSAIVVSTLPIMCAYPFLQKYFVQGVMIGSIKS